MTPHNQADDLSSGEFAQPILVGKHVVCRMTGMSVSTIQRRVADAKNGQGTFPLPVRLGGVCRWVLAEVLAWIEEQKSKRRTGGADP